MAAAAATIACPRGRRGLSRVRRTAAGQGHSKKVPGDEVYDLVPIFAEVFAGLWDWDACASDEGDGGVAQGGEWPGAGAHATAIFVECHVANVVESVLDAPVVAYEGEQTVGTGLVGRQAGGEIDDLDAFLSPAFPVALEAGNLRQSGPGEMGYDLVGDGDLAALDAAMALFQGLRPAQIGRGIVRGGNRRRRRWRGRAASRAGCA